jgi:hypothetical protein
VGGFMADENQAIEQGNQAPSVDETLKNLKSEFSRKQENVSKELEQIKNMLGGLANQQQAAQQRHKVDEADIPDPILNPKGYKEYLKQEIMQETSQALNQNNQRQSQLSALVQNYPELQDGNSDLTKKAVENYSRLSSEEKMSPNAYKFAVQDAAAELGVLAMSKRQNNKNGDDDSFTTNSGSYSSNKPSSKQNRSSEKIDEATLAFAQAIGKDTSDPKYIETLKKIKGERKNWNRGQ